MTTTIGFFSALALSAVLMAEPPGGQIPQTSRDAAALQEWTLGIEAYQVLRDQAARIIPPPRLPAYPSELLRAEAAFAAEIRARRAEAQVGDLFTFDVRRTFRKLIARAITDHQIAVNDLVADLLSEIRPTINQRFPWQLATSMPPCLLAALPTLPKELQYRLVGRDLILVDVDANIVIDILPEAVPRPAVPTTAFDTYRR